jgi:hypothetical protein
MKKHPKENAGKPMNILIQTLFRWPRKHSRSSFTLIGLVLACFVLRTGPNAFGLVPPPDGGYPNFTTAEGTKALQNLTTGAANTGVGWYSLFSATTASFNTGLGAGALALNTADENTAIGAAALLLNTASGNTAVGSRALLNNTTGGTLGNIQGFDFGPNVAVGQQALESNTVASANTAIGYQALHSFTTGPVGLEQLGFCTAVGFQALANATGDGAANNAFGYQALMNNTDGTGNTAIGLRALFGNTTGESNVAIGNNALLNNDIGPDNTAIGNSALLNNTTGSLNTAIGVNALVNNTTGGANIALGVSAGSGVITASNVIAIGAIGADVSNSCYIGSIFGQTSSGTAVFIDSGGKLGTVTSSKRFKEDIERMDKTSEALFALKPVTFRYKKGIDPAGTSQFGLVAEEVAEVNPDLVVRDKEGNPYTVRYDQVNAMLLNEFLKEHKRVEQQQATIAELKSTVAHQREDFEATIARLRKEIEAVVAHSKEQDSRIQQVRTQLEFTKPVARFTHTTSH